MKAILFGGGNMGAALASGLVSHGVAAPSDLHIVERDEERRSFLTSSLGVGCTSSVSALDSFDTVVIAVKPQDSRSLCGELSALLKKHHLVISVMAGVALEALQSALSHEAVVRAMPNVGAKVGSSMTVYCASDAVTPAQNELVKQIFMAAGEVVQVEKNALVDVATAISGSGPAYLYYAIEQLMAVAQDLGFSAADSRTLIAGTVTGATRLWVESGEEAAALRAQVTSKGGTTEAGLRELMNAGVGPAVENAIRAAYQRATELAALFSEGQ